MRDRSPVTISRTNFQELTAKQTGIMIAVALAAVMITSIPALFAPFALIDDHEILRFSHVGPRHPQAQPAVALGDVLRFSEWDRGRFRPVHYSSRFALYLALRQRAELWHAAFLLMGVVSLFALYFACHSVTGDLAISGLFVINLASIRGVSESWVRLGVNEIVGFFFLSLAAAAYARSRRAIDSRQETRLLSAAVLALGLAMLSKESFILLGPAVVFLHVALGGRGGGASESLVGFRDVFVVGVCILTVALLAVTVVTAVSHPQSEGGVAILSLWEYLHQGFRIRLRGRLEVRAFGA